MGFFKEQLGCFWAVIKAFLLFYAIFSLLAGKDTFTAWLIIIGEIINVLLSLVSRWITTRRSRHYNREESYWSKKADESDTKKEE